MLASTHSHPHAGTPTSKSSSGDTLALQSVISSVKPTTFPNIPLLAGTTPSSSPPEVSSAAALGSTASYPEASSCSRSLREISQLRTKEEENLPTAGIPAHSSTPGDPGDPFIEYEHRPTSVPGIPTFPRTRTMSAPADPGRLPSQLSKPVRLIHSRSEPPSTTKTTPPKSSLRLKLPPPNMHNGLGIGITIDHQNSLVDGDIQANQDQHRLRQSLLRLAFPTTPDTSLNNMPVLCAVGGKEGKSHRPGNGGDGSMDGILGGGGGGGGGTAALLTANSRMASGGLALLTPPDDTGVLEWHQLPIDAIHTPQITQLASLSESQSKGGDKPALEEGGQRILGAMGITQSEASESSNQEHGGGMGQHGFLEKGKEIIIQEKLERANNDRPDGMEEGWLSSAISYLLNSRIPVQMNTEAVRVLSYTLPCPLPVSSSDPITAPSTSNAGATNPGRLPASAASAPAVAAAAGHQLSPAMVARCASKAREESGRSTPTTSDFPALDDGVTTALHLMLNSIQRVFSRDGTRRVFIHVSHAISPHIPLKGLPSTPPLISGSPNSGSTPGLFGSPAFETPFGGSSSGGGYFSPNVFNSIVVAPSSTMSTPNAGISSHHPPLVLPSPNPILPPSSLHLTLLERYIPPSTAAEDAEMFSPSSSILLDRLFELSPHGGSLLFIYPTKTGAVNFNKQYLGPVLDPLLRKLMVLYMLREDLLWGIRNMVAVDKMAEYDVLKERVEAFCRKLSEVGSGNSTPTNDFPKHQQQGMPHRMPVNLVYASKAIIPLNELSWREWWTQQEQLRIREVVKRHFANLPPPGEAPPPPPPPKPSSPLFAKFFGSSSKTASSRSPSKSTKSTSTPFPSHAATSTAAPPVPPASPKSSSSSFSYGYGPGDLAREVLDGVRAPAVRPSSRGMGEAVLASALSGSGGGGGGTGGVGGVVGDMEIGIGSADPNRAFFMRQYKERGVEVGIFVLRRGNIEEGEY